LHSRGVIVARRIEPEVIQRLHSAAGSAPRFDPGEDSHASETEEDGADVISAQVRSLASEAYRVLRRPGDHSPVLSAEVTARIIEQLAQFQSRLVRLQQLHNLRLEGLLRWVSNLRHLLHEQL